MFGRKTIDLTAPDALKVFEAELAASLRRLEFESAGKRLLAALHDTHGGYASLCKRIADRYIAIDGWDELWADLELFRRRGVAITAIGIDLSGYGDGPEPALETSVYDDRDFPFSQGDRAGLLAACDGKRPWTGAFVDNPSQLMIRGLAPVHQFLTQLRGEGTPHERTAARLAWWYIVFRIHHAIHRDLEKQGLPHAMPVMIGEHGFGVDFRSVYMGRTGKSRDKAVAAVLDKRSRNAARAHDRQTDAIVQALRERRRAMRGWAPDHNPDKRETYRQFIEAHETVTFDMLGIRPGRPSWRMDDDAFKVLLDEIRTARRKGCKAA